MVFSSNIFLFAFLPLVLLFYFLLPQNLLRKNNAGTSCNIRLPNPILANPLLAGLALPNLVLVIFSLIFYAWGEIDYLALLLAAIIANYFFGLVLQSLVLQKQQEEKTVKITPHQRKLRLFFTIAIVFNLASLGYFKYANFFIATLNQVFLLEIANKKIHLPIGISFFTFHAISYLTDIYRGKCKAQKNIADLALYIAFFPQLIAGPIVRYNFIEKYLSKRRYSFTAAAYGIRRFIIGLGKKIIIANPLGQLADAIFASPLSEINSALAWIGLACYTLQIYFDFSGYCDMAIGLARLFGFKFPENFNYPYRAKSVREFWRRWHISLSAWFRDYVYIPLGGNKVTLQRQYFNLILVFFLCGLWHGASWNFVVWGLFHGFFLVFERTKAGKHFLDFMPQIIRHFYTIFIVMLGWVFFRSPDLNYSIGFLKVMFSGNDIEIFSTQIQRLLKSHFIWMSFGLALTGFCFPIKNLIRNLIKNLLQIKNYQKITMIISDLFLIAVLLLSILKMAAATYNPFIYFQF